MNVAAYPLEDTDNVLKFLRTASLSVVNKLEKLEFVQCGLNDIQAGMIVRNIVPKFPNLKNLIHTRNEIKSVQSIVERIIKNDTTALPLKLFHTLDLRGNPIMNVLKKQPEEKKALLCLLEALGTTICCLGSKNISDCDPNTQYALYVNHAGRYFLEGNSSSTINNNNNSGYTVVRCHRRSLLPPLSLWPIILERAYEKSNDVFVGEKDATGLNYLLRTGSH